MLSAYLKPAIAAVAVIALGVDGTGLSIAPTPKTRKRRVNALVVVTKSTNACFSDLVRVTGFIVPRREAVVGVDQEGSKVSDVLSAKANWSPTIRNWPD